MKHVFVIGSKGIPAQYGGFETFVEKLTEGQQCAEIKYYVACLADNNNEFEHNGAHCFNVKVPNIGPAKAVYYDMKAFEYCNRYIKRKQIDDAVVYVLACRIGPFINYYKKQLIKLGGTLYINPDGHEWKRAKWNWLIRKYWKLSEKLMVKHADLLICDSRNIEKYIQDDYKKYNPKTTYIAYGADVCKSRLQDNSKEWLDWCEKHHVNAKEYYLVVGRFVPENNYETMIREFMKSRTKKDFVLVTNVENNKFYDVLKQKTGFDKDNRIKFVGTVYDQQLLKKIREEAYAYFHGHEVGGTNPSLLEALASTDVNLLVDVSFNREVAEDSAMYWSKDDGELCKLIDKSDNMLDDYRAFLAQKSTERITDEFSWTKIISDYEKILRV